MPTPSVTEVRKINMGYLQLLMKVKVLFLRQSTLHPSIERGKNESFGSLDKQGSLTGVCFSLVRHRQTLPVLLSHMLTSL